MSKYSRLRTKRPPRQSIKLQRHEFQTKPNSPWIRFANHSSLTSTYARRYNRIDNATMRALALTLTLLSPALYGATEFNRDVRPILADKCYACHAADAVAKKIPLRLDS